MLSPEVEGTQGGGRGVAGETRVAGYHVKDLSSQAKALIMDTVRDRGSFLQPGDQEETRDWS